MDLSESNDAELVTASLAGSREAFHQIVERYQTLIPVLTLALIGWTALVIFLTRPKPEDRGGISPRFLQ